MELGFTGGIALVVLLGVVGQVAAKALKVPSILLLLALGLVAGPVTGLVDPDALLGKDLFPLVSMAVGILLFEESLKLDMARLKGGARRPVALLVTVGAVLTGIGATAICWWVLDLPLSRAAVIGAILIVSGPTVVGPLLAIIRPKQPLESVLAFEGIFIDPIGAPVARAWATGALPAAPAHVGAPGCAGNPRGAGPAAVYVVAVRWGRVPAAAEVSLAFATALATYAIAEAFHEEAGLFATTTLGIALANQRWARIEPLHEFGSHVGLLLIGTLFILLTARVDLDALATYALSTLAIVALLVLVLRPLVASIATTGSVLSSRERVMVGWMAPRGIVAASTASVFALRFEQDGQPFEQLVPVVFGVILLTAVIYGLTGPWVAARLGVRSEGPEHLDDDGVPIAQVQARG